jgi:ABC-type proline/glycine betaine transport system permease subunit
MTALLTATVSILAISGVAWAAKKRLRAPVCPICLGVGGTWLWMVIGRSLGYAVDSSMLAILLGGSVVGIAYQVERRLPQGRSPLLWKTLFTPAGFVAAYALVEPHWILFAVTSAALVLLSVFFLVPPAAREEQSETVEDLKKKMQQCC